MHDYHAVQELIDRLRSDTGGGVIEVRIRVGAAFSPEALEQAYEMLTPGTPLEGSRLVVEDAPETRACPVCRASWTPARDERAMPVLVCPSCGTPAPNPGAPRGAPGSATTLDVIGVSRRTETGGS